MAKRLMVTQFRRSSVRRTTPIDNVEPDRLTDKKTKTIGVDLEIRECLADALQQLPREHLAAVEQQYMLDEPDDGLAREMDVKVATVRKWRSRGIKTLQKILIRHDAITC